MKVLHCSINQSIMKTKIQLFLFFFCTPFALSAQWNYLNGPFSFETYMEVVNNDTLVFSDGATGKIFHSFDGGDSWSAFDTELEYSWIFDFDFPTDQVGYGCGGTYFGMYTDVIIKTEDAGQTWDTLTTNRYGVYTFNTIEFVNVDTGFVASGDLLLRTEDGGVSFTPLSIVDEGVFSIANLSSTSDGVLFASTRLLISPNAYEISIYRSADLGDSWLQVYSDTMEDTDNFNNRFIGSIHFPTPEIGYAVGGNGIFLKTVDAGLTWAQSFISPFSNLTSVYFTSANVGYINNAGGIYKTTDGGTTWEIQNMNVPAIVHDIQFASSEIGYAKTDHNIYKTTNGGEITAVSELNANVDIQIFPNPSNDIIKLNHPSGIEIQKIELMDIVGKTIQAFSNPVSSIDVSKLPAGNYLLKLDTNKGSVVKKILVE